MLEPYEQAEDGYCGYPIHSDEKLEALVLAALRGVDSSFWHIVTGMQQQSSIFGFLKK